MVPLACGVCPVSAFLLQDNSLDLWPVDVVIVNDMESEQSLEAIM